MWFRDLMEAQDESPDVAGVGVGGASAGVGSGGQPGPRPPRGHVGPGRHRSEERDPCVSPFLSASGRCFSWQRRMGSLRFVLAGSRCLAGREGRPARRSGSTRTWPRRRVVCVKPPSPHPRRLSVCVYLCLILSPAGSPSPTPGRVRPWQVEREEGPAGSARCWGDAQERASISVPLPLELFALHLAVAVRLLSGLTATLTLSCDCQNTRVRRGRR